MRKASKVLLETFAGSFEVEKMRQEVAGRFQMLIVLWSILVVSLGTGFPTRHKNVAHKVSFRQTFYCIG